MGPETAARAPDGTPGRAGRARLVVINDDTPFLELMEALLEGEEGYEVHVRKEWNNAYEYVKEMRPDLVILDIVMGSEERGWNILNLLTLDPETRGIPVVVCSAAVQSLRQHAPMMERHGISALAKPFDLEQLLAAVEQMLASVEDGEGGEGGGRGEGGHGGERGERGRGEESGGPHGLERLSPAPTGGHLSTPPGWSGPGGRVSARGPAAPERRAARRGRQGAGRGGGRSAGGAPGAGGRRGRGSGKGSGRGSPGDATGGPGRLAGARRQRRAGP